MISRNSEVINEAYEGLDVKDLSPSSEDKPETKQKPAPKKKIEKKKKAERKIEQKQDKSDEKLEKPLSTDPGEAEALKLYNEAVAKGINPADIGNHVGDIVSDSDKKPSPKPVEPEPEVAPKPKK